MNMKLFAAAAATAFVASAASAQTVFDTSLQNVNGTFGTSTATTTTDSTGTRTVVTGPGPNSSANRAQGTPVVGQWYQANVGAGSTVGITTDYARSGNGSAYFAQSQAQTGKGDLVYNFSAPVALSSLTGMSFDFYRDGASTTDANFAPVMRLGMRENGVFAGSLVLENVYQQQQPAPVNTWTTLSADLNNGIFWAPNALLGPTFADANGGQKTLAQWIAGNSGTTLEVFSLEIGFGSGWSGTFAGGVDNVNATFGQTVVASNFEVAAPVPEPATWAMMIAGFGVIGAGMRRRKVAVRFA